MKKLPTWKELNKYLSYDAESGQLTWKVDIRYSKVKAGTVAGSRTGKYIRVWLNGQHYYAHRIAWMLVTKSSPAVIDHINGNGTDNRWVNLRSTDPTGNRKNTKLNANNTSGSVGVSKSRNKWRAVIKHEKKTIYLGTFNTKEQAIEARKVAEEKYGFHPNHGKR